MALFDYLVSYYKFERDNSVQKDSGPFARHGTRAGSVTRVDSGKANLGYAARFAAGSGNYISVPSHNGNELWKTCTLGLVLRVNSYASAGGVLTKTDANTSFSAGFRIDSSTLHITEGGANKFTNLHTVVPADGNFHWIMLSTDANGANPTMSLFVDGASAGTATTGYYLFGNSHDLRMGACENSFFGSGTTAPSIDLAEVAFWNTNLALADNQAWYASGNGLSLTQTGITIDEVGAYGIYQRNKDGSNTVSISRTGTYTTGTPATIELIVYDWTDGVTVVQNWTRMSNAVFSNGDWAATITVPVHTNFHKYAVRTKDANGNVLETSATTLGRVGAGAIYLSAGQSNMERLFSQSPAGMSNAKTSIFYGGNWCRSISASKDSFNSLGPAANTLIDKLQVGKNMPVGVIHTALGGMGLYQTDGSGYWLDTAGGSPYALALTQISLAGGDFEGVIWQQGEADAHAGTTTAQYLGALQTFYSRLQAVTGRNTSQLLFHYASLCTLADGSTAANVSGIRTALLKALGFPGFKFAADILDLTRSDNYHLDATGRTRFASRLAQGILFNEGLAAFGAGPVITKATIAIGSAVIRLKCDLRGSGGLIETDGSTDGGSLTGFEATVNNFGATLTINSTAFEQPDTIALTLSAAPSSADILAGNLKVRSGYGATPTVTNQVFGNRLPQGDTVGTPLQPTTYPIRVVPNNESFQNFAALDPFYTTYLERLRS